MGNRTQPAGRILTTRLPGSTYIFILNRVFLRPLVYPVFLMVMLIYSRCRNSKYIGSYCYYHFTVILQLFFAVKRLGRELRKCS